MTELVFILDKSGSMSGLESDTIGGFNAMLDKQKRVEGECFITTALFDNTYELLHNRLPIKAVKAITAKEYCVGGSTALLDAIGRTVHTIENAQKHLQAEYQAEQVLVVIITDGQENASREYGPDAIKDLIVASMVRCPVALGFKDGATEPVTSPELVDQEDSDDDMPKITRTGRRGRPPKVTPPVVHLPSFLSYKNTFK